jgi:hypothetical protein
MSTNYLPYHPTTRNSPNTIKVASAWGDIPTILKDIIERFGIKQESAIEFGVEYGYSTSALANYFDNVVGVDIFTGDIHAGYKGDIFFETFQNLQSYSNIRLIKDSYQNFIINYPDQRYNLAHVDIVHTYEDTFRCGDWCLEHSDVVIFHDTLSFPEVFRACQDLSIKHNLTFYNYEASHGLGILVKVSE